MLGITDLQPGVVFRLHGKPFLVIASTHKQLGRGSGIQNIKARNLIEGTVLNLAFKGNESFEEIELDRRSVNYLYHDQNQAYFMDQETFDQFSWPRDLIKNQLQFLNEGQAVQLIYLDGRPSVLELPIKVKLTVQQTDPGIKGDRVSSGTKSAQLETGAIVQVPLFVKNGDTLVIDTRDGSYVERTKK